MKSRRIAVIGIGFYDYETAIVKHLESLGAKVVLLSSISNILNNRLCAGVINRIPILYKWFAKYHERILLKRFIDNSFEQILVINGVNLSIDFIKKLRNIQFKAELILYLWDSLQRLPGIESRLSLFNKALTFDRFDAQNNSLLRFRPLFYRYFNDGKFVNEPNKIDFDLAFIGWMHSDRLQTIINMKSLAEAHGLSVYIYLYTGFLTWLRLIMRSKSKGVHWRPISYSSLLLILSKTRCIVDLPHPLQTGLTMRAIEAIGLRRKLLTSGGDIINYDFFCHDNIMVFDSGAINISRDFLDSPVADVPENIIKRYSLKAWVNDVFQN